MARNFRGTKFSRFSRISLRPRKFYPRNFTHNAKPQPFPAIGVAYFRNVDYSELSASVCAMAMYRYFSSVDKLPKRPDPTGYLSTKVPSSSIVLANAGSKSVLEESVMWVWLNIPSMGVAFRSSNREKFFSRNLCQRPIHENFVSRKFFAVRYYFL